MTTHWCVISFRSFHDRLLPVDVVCWCKSREEGNRIVDAIGNRDRKRCYACTNTDRADYPTVVIMSRFVPLMYEELEE